MFGWSFRHRRASLRTSAVLHGKKVRWAEPFSTAVREEDRAMLLAHVISTVGQVVLEKSGAVEGGSRATH